LSLKESSSTYLKLVYPLVKDKRKADTEQTQEIFHPWESGSDIVIFGDSLERMTFFRKVHKSENSTFLQDKGGRNRFTKVNTQTLLLVEFEGALKNDLN
jgi:hypothetical protein